MRWHVVELAENGRYAKVGRGFLIVLDGQKTLGQVVLDELSCLVVSAEQATISKPLMVRPAELGIPVVFCGNNYHPVSITLPYSNHHQSNRILSLQIAVSVPLRKRLWQRLVKQKIINQLTVLKTADAGEQQHAPIKRLERLAEKVRSGDPTNNEAQAAKLYWQAVMGQGFRRLPAAEDFINGALNYGYTVIRAACARATCAAGLQPALGLHHHNQNNPFRLVDDLMEPFRPLVDLVVIQWLKDENMPSERLESEHKAALAKVLTRDLNVDETSTPVSSAMEMLAFSLVKSLEENSVQLKLPTIP